MQHMQLLVATVAVLSFACNAMVAQERPNQLEVFPKGWVDLFRPPYSNNPGVIMSLACIDATLCLVPAASNGAGVSVFTFDGSIDGAFVPMVLDGMTPLMIMGIAAGGSPQAPHGVAGGPDIFGGLKYLVNTTTWSTPLALPFVALIGITADAETGERVMFPDLLADTDSIWVSSNGGITFTSFNVSAPLPTSNCTYARYIANPTADVIYMTFGNFPNATKNNGNALAEKLRANAPFTLTPSERTEVHFDGKGGVRRVRHSGLDARRNHAMFGSSSSSSSGFPDYCGFSAAILKSTDGGSSWTTLLSDASSWYPNEISCSSATHCVFVGEGDDGIRIYRTVDGTTFEEVLHTPNTDVEVRFLQTVAISPKNASFVFAAGGKETTAGREGLFLTSEDGGATWMEHQSVNFIGEVMQVSVGKDGTAFAAAETLFQSATILRFNPTGPPLTAAPAYLGNFTQKVCNQSSPCDSGCVTTSLPQNACLQMNGGGSLSNACDMTNQVLIQKIFILSDSCEGPAEEGVAPLGVCLNGNGNSLEFYCGPSTSEAQGNDRTGYLSKGVRS